MAKIKSGIKVSAPATISNLGSGLDSMALALSGLSDEIVVKQVNEPGIHIQSITGDQKRLSTDLDKNCAGLAALKTWEYLKASDLIDPSIGLSMELRKKISIGSGLGSSAASAVAGAMAVNEFFSRPLEQKALLPFAVAGEKLSCSNPSFASVGAALWGGWILMRDQESLDIHRLPLLRGIYLVVLSPYKTVLSEDARTVLNESQVSFAAAQQQAANTAGLILGLYNSNFDLIQSSMQDHIGEELFSKHVPYFKKLQDISMQGGALAANVSGSGPSFFAFCNNSLKAEEISKKLENLYTHHKIKHNIFISEINQLGAKIQ